MPSDLTPELLNELDRLEREASPGPWRYVGGRLWTYGRDKVTNETFIAVLRNAAPALLAAARREQQTVARLAKAEWLLHLLDRCLAPADWQAVMQEVHAFIASNEPKENKQ